MNASEICEAVKKGELIDEIAVDQLIELGYGRPEAEELVFIAKGGDDVVLPKDAGGK